MKYDWSKERIESVIADCDSLSQVLEKLNIPRAGNNTATLRKKLEEFNIDYSHFTYGAKGKKGIENYVPVKEYLGTGKYIQTTKLKEKLIKEGLKKNECENPKCPCKNGYWLDNPISYQLHHINGKHDDNRLENLQILCPNCHSQTDNWGTKKLKNINYCKDCGKEISRSSTYCIKCAVKHRNQFKVDPKDRPDKEKLLSLIKEYPFTKIGEMYGVTDNTIRKWCKNYGIPHTKKELRELILENK